MSNTILTLNNITKKFNNFYALNNISFKVNEGDIIGLVGENGAGKTTLMRIIAGLSNKTSGDLYLFGKSSNYDRKNMGVLIENPAYYGDMSAIENLEIIRIAKKIKDKDIIYKVLNIVGLKNYENKNVKNFSLGMRQRLAIAIALLGNPKFLILDEPINGLDPNGIIEIRNIILKLNKEYNITFLISSHILTELHKIATKYAILHNGEIIDYSGAKELEEKCNNYNIIKYTGNKEEIINILQNYEINIISDTKNLLKFKTNIELPDNFLKTLNNNLNYCSILEYNTIQENLEQYFLRITNERKK